MPGSREGGLKAAAKNLANDPDFYKRIGQRGGKAKSPYKGFGSNKDLAREVGRKGGMKSRPPKSLAVSNSGTAPAYEN